MALEDWHVLGSGVVWCGLYWAWEIVVKRGWQAVNIMEEGRERVG